MRTPIPYMLLFFIMLVSPRLAEALDVLILQSGRSPVYTDALRGLHGAAKLDSKTLVLSDYSDVDVQRLVREERPRLLIALGDRALNECRKTREVPVLALLSLALTQRAVPDHIGGIAMTAAPEHYLELFAQMRAKRVGVLYDPRLSGLYVKRALAEAEGYGVTIVTETLRNPRDLQGKLEKLKGDIDLLWLLPDSTAITTVNLEALLVFSMTQAVPAVSFTGQYVKNGAAVALDIDPHDMGGQAGEMAQSLLRSSWGHRVPIVDPRKVRLQVNESVLRKLHLKPPSH
ncbi:ABC transporter substrate-binding protein [Geomonas terrae]|uniref:ABC transporter substrate-binding protein n=1 Tax=Geomonas terrae TaxID=2562681 RepID=A0A4S1CAE2_9BACT|nr:ABC transporter substrate binding protein [Geomonas terrae]TGU70274.1 ABC transporter substrate-binding protein [Geomonas terrae]